MRRNNPGKYPSIVRDLAVELSKEVEKAFDADEDIPEDDDLLISTLISGIIATIDDGQEAGLKELEPLKIAL